MSKTDVPNQKTHASGSWRIVRSVTVPANVTPEHSSESSLHQSGQRKAVKPEEQSAAHKPRNTPAYFETPNHLLSRQ